jgi:hypothetical protein
MQADQDTIDEFRQYVALILNLYDRERYLSKNNNSILRLASLVTAFPNSTLIIPFRDPVAHALSLLKQHEGFLKTHAESAFSRKYMTWLAHHEFGADHRRFDFNDAQDKTYGDPLELSYWLDLWIEAHSYLIGQADKFGKQIMFFSYERLISAPEETRARLFSQLDLTPSAPLEIREGRPLPTTDLPQIGEARVLYDDLTRRTDVWMT